MRMVLPPLSLEAWRLLVAMLEREQCRVTLAWTALRDVLDADWESVWEQNQRMRMMEVATYDDGWAWRTVTRSWRHDTLEYDLHYTPKLLP